MEADFHREYGIRDLQRELRRRTWRWFTVRVTGLSPESAWTDAIRGHASTAGGERRESVAVLDDPAAIDAFFARQAAG